MEVVARRCGFLWQKHAMFRVEVTPAASGLCGEMNLYHQISPSFGSTIELERWRALNGHVHDNDQLS